MKTFSDNEAELTHAFYKQELICYVGITCMYMIVVDLCWHEYCYLYTVALYLGGCWGPCMDLMIILPWFVGDLHVLQLVSPISKSCSEYILCSPDPIWIKFPSYNLNG